jgi:phosphopantothenoylcysteine decarboxylase/phosphopantothenate--cysteine ligase
MLQGKKILIGITAGIAAYKIPLLVRLLIKNGAEVKVIMTASASSFITPLTLSVLSKNPVYIDFHNEKTGEWNNHVELGLWADIMLVAPATANTLAKMANGQADNLLLATYLSARCDVSVAPAMDLDMWKHPSTQENINKLKESGVEILNPESGELASGLSGEGRMQEPEALFEYIQTKFDKGVLKGKKIVVTAGPTHEAIDPVRFIGNNSSGKMGVAIADNAYELGAEVTLICGPSKVESKYSYTRNDVVSAAEMFEAVKALQKDADVIIMAAAVADYTPKQVAAEKIKKKEVEFNLELSKTTDILKYLGENKTINQILIGFALETENEEQQAFEKLKSKNLDFIVLNSLKDKGAGFDVETNKITIIDKNNKIEKFVLKSKQQVAEDILTKLTRIFNER